MLRGDWSSSLLSTATPQIDSALAMADAQSRTMTIEATQIGTLMPAPPRRRDDPSGLGAHHPLDQRDRHGGDDRLRLGDLQRLAAVRLHASRERSRSAAGSRARCSGISRRCGCWRSTASSIVALGLATGRFRRKLLADPPRRGDRRRERGAARASSRTTISRSTTPCRSCSISASSWPAS